MKKGLFQYIGDSFKTLFHNRVLLFAGFIEVLFMAFALLISQGGGRGSSPGIFRMILFIGILGLIASFMLAGKINMAKKVYDPEEEEPVEVSDYFEGIRKFGLKVFGGSMFLLVVALIVALPIAYISFRAGSGFLMILMLIVLGVAFLFLSLWDTILVVDDIGVSDAFGDSISFVKANFWVVLGLNIFSGLITTNDILSPAGMLDDSQGAAVETGTELSFLYQWVIDAFGGVGWGISALMFIVFSVISTMVFVDLYMDRRNRYGSFS